MTYSSARHRSGVGAFILGCCGSPLLMAQSPLPTGMAVLHGDLEARIDGKTLNLRQSTRRAIAEWQGFDIAPGHRVALDQPDALSALLARVTSGDPTAIHGRIDATGQLFLINPRGILVGEGGSINTAGFLASTLQLTDQDFLRGGPLVLQALADSGAVINLGRIEVEGGDAVLVGLQVRNEGTVHADEGKAILAAGGRVVLQPDADLPLLLSAPEGAPAETGVSNDGIVAAAEAVLQAAGGNPYALAINQRGVVRATGVERRDGRVLITAEGGAVAVSGTVSARNADGSGGRIHVGGGARGRDPAIANAASVTVDENAVLDASATVPGSAGGEVIVWADEVTRFAGRIEARGGVGGFAEVSGATLEFSGSADLRAEHGEAGTLLLDPVSLTIQNAGPDSDPLDPAASSVLTVATLEDQLAMGNVVVDTSGHLGNAMAHDPAVDMDGSIVLADPLGWAGTTTLTLRADNSVHLNADLSAPDGHLRVELGEAVPDGPAWTRGLFTLDAGARLQAASLTLDNNPDATVTLNPYPGGPGFLSQGARLDGTLDLDQFDLRLAAPADGIVLGRNPANRIRRLSASRGDWLPSVDIVNGAGELRLSGDFRAGGVNNVVSGARSAFFRAVSEGDLVPDDAYVAVARGGSDDDFFTRGERDPIVLASRAGAFRNLGGSLDGSWLLFSDAPASTQLGGLSAPARYDTAYADLIADDPAQGLLDHAYAGDFFPRTGVILYRAALAAEHTLTIRADDTRRLFGDDNPAFSASYSGFEPGDDASLLEGFALTFHTAATRESPVGTYTITPAGAPTVGDYGIDYQSGTLSIDPRPLTIAARDVTLHYRDDAPAWSADFIGLAPFHTPDDIAGLRFDAPASDPAVGHLTLDVGEYAIVPRGAADPNYGIGFEPGTLSIQPRPVSITARDKRRPYGAADPVFDADIVGYRGPGSATAPPGLRLRSRATADAEVGEYTIEVSLPPDPNYTWNLRPGTLAIEPATLTLHAGAYRRAYGEPNPVFDGAQVFGLAPGHSVDDVLGEIFYSTAAHRGSDAGLYAVQARASLENPNYRLRLAPGELRVDRAPLRLRLRDAERPYGEENPTIQFDLEGLRNGDDATAVAGSATTAATARSRVGDYTIGFSDLRSRNYEVEVVPGTLRVRKRPLLARPADLSREYGDSNPALVPGFEGLASFDQPGDVFPSLRFETSAGPGSPVGHYAIIMEGPASGPKAVNYDIVRGAASLQVTPAPLHVSPAHLRLIFGDPLPDALPQPEVTGFKRAEDRDRIRFTLPALPSTRPGAGDYVLDYALDASVPAAANYTIAGPGSLRLSIAPRPVHVSLSNVQSIYGEDFDIEITGVDNFVPPLQHLADGEEAETLEDWLAVTSAADARSDAGSYRASVTALSPNYEVAGISGGRIEIGRRHLALKPATRAVTYGDGFDPFDMVVAGLDGLAPFHGLRDVVQDMLMTGDTGAVLAGSQDSLERLPAGGYVLEPVFTPGMERNYAIDAWPGLLAVNPRLITLRVAEGTIYHRSEPERQLPLEADNLPAFVENPEDIYPGFWRYRLTSAELPPAGEALTQPDLLRGLPEDLDDDHFRARFPDRASASAPPPTEEAPEPGRILDVVVGSWSRITPRAEEATPPPADGRDYVWVQPDLGERAERFGDDAFDRNYLLRVESVRLESRPDGSRESAQAAEFAERELAARRAFLEPPAAGAAPAPPLPGFRPETVPALPEILFSAFQNTADAASGTLLSSILNDLNKGRDASLTEGELLVWLYEHRDDASARAAVSTLFTDYVVNVLPTLTGDELSPASAALKSELEQRMRIQRDRMIGLTQSKVEQWRQEQARQAQEQGGVNSLATLFDYGGDPPFLELMQEAAGDLAQRQANAALAGAALGAGVGAAAGSLAATSVLAASSVIFPHLLESGTALVMLNATTAVGAAPVVGAIAAIGTVAVVGALQVVERRDTYEAFVGSRGQDMDWSSVDFDPAAGDGMAEFNRFAAAMAITGLLAGEPLDGVDPATGLDTFL